MLAVFAESRHCRSPFLPPTVVRGGRRSAGHLQNEMPTVATHNVELQHGARIIYDTETGLQPDESDGLEPNPAVETIVSIPQVQVHYCGE